MQLVQGRSPLQAKCLLLQRTQAFSAFLRFVVVVVVVLVVVVVVVGSVEIGVEAGMVVDMMAFRVGLT